MAFNSKYCEFLKIGSSLRRELTIGAIGNLVLFASYQAVTFITSIFLARVLGAESYGIYVSAMAVVFLLGVLSSFGFHTLIVRLVAAYSVKRSWGLMRGLIEHANRVVLGCSLLLYLFGSLLVWMFFERIGPQKSATFWWALSILPFMGLSTLRSATLRGLRRVILGQIPDYLVMPATFLWFLWIYQLIGLNLTPTSTVALRMAATAIAFAIGTYLMFRCFPNNARVVKADYEIQNWWRSAFPLMFLGSMIVITLQTDILMLSFLCSSEAAGIYQAASRGAQIVILAMIILNFVFQPTLSRLYAANETDRLQRLVIIGSRISLLIALPITLFLVLSAKFIMVTVFGNEFQSGSTCLIILSIAHFVRTGLGMTRELLTMTGYEKYAALGAGIGAGSNICLNAAFIPFWGIEGAAYATGLSLVIWDMVLLHQIRHRLGLTTTPLSPLNSNFRSASGKSLQDCR